MGVRSPLPTRQLPLTLLLLGWALHPFPAPLPVFGTTWRLDGVNSNILVDGENAVFMQRDGSLTVLNAETGDVRFRQRVLHFPEYGRFYSLEEGILWIGLGTRLFDRASFNLIAQPAFMQDIGFREVDSDFGRTLPSSDLIAQHKMMHYSRMLVYRPYRTEPQSTFKFGTGILEFSTLSDPFVLHYRGEDTEWYGCLPYLDGSEAIVALTENDGRLYIGTGSGQVECIDLQEGRSVWIYCFPTLRWCQLQPSDPSWPGDAAAAWHRNARNLPKTVGMVRLPGRPREGESVRWKNHRSTFTGRVVVDPAPEKRYESFERNRLIAWMPVAILVLALFIGPRRHKLLSVPIFVIAWVVSVLGVLNTASIFILGDVLIAYSRSHFWVWSLASYAFGAMLFWWRARNQLFKDGG